MNSISISLRNGETKESFLERLNEEVYKKDPSKTLVKIVLDDPIQVSDKKSYDRVVELSAQVKSLGFDSAMILKAKDSVLTADEIDRYIEMESDIEKNDSILAFDGGMNEEYSLNDLLSADQKIRAFVDDLKSKQLSPFENYLKIYDFLTQKVYNESEKCSSESRDVISVMNGDKIVCVGYAKVMQRLCSEIGIRCETQGSVVYDKKGKKLSGHRNNAVYINDPKYGIKGWFYSDACWDSVQEGKEHKRRYNYCLIPISDKDKMRDSIIKIDESTNVSALYNEGQNLSSYEGLINKEKQAETKEECDKKATDLLFNEKNVISAYNKLITLLKTHDVPADIYKQCEGKKEYGLYHLFGKILIGKDKEAEESIIKLLEIAKNGKSGRNFVDEPENVYKELEDRKIGVRCIFHKKVTVLVKMDKESSDKLDRLRGKKARARTFEELYEIEQEIKKLNSRFRKSVTRKVKKDDVSRFFWREHGASSEELQLETYKEVLREMKKDVQPIPLKAFTDALHVVYEAEGVPKKSIDFEVNNAIDGTVESANRAFDGAANCFSEESRAKKAGQERVS